MWITAKLLRMPSTTFEDSRKRDEEVKKLIRSGSATDFRNKGGYLKAQKSPLYLLKLLSHLPILTMKITSQVLFAEGGYSWRRHEWWLVKEGQRDGPCWKLWKGQASVSSRCRRSQTLLMSRDKRQHPLQSSLITPFLFLTPLCNSYPFRSARCRFVVFGFAFYPIPLLGILLRNLFWS